MRPPVVSGLFYPDDSESLLSMISDFLRRSNDFSLTRKPSAIIVPHAGYIYSGIVAASAYKLVHKYINEYSKVIIIGPSHYIAFDGVASYGRDIWETPLGMFEVDGFSYGVISINPAMYSKEHSIEVQMPFLQVVLPNVTYIPLLVGDVDPITFAEDLLPHIDDNTLLVVSSDLSHYYAYDEAIKIDSIANKCIPSLDYECVFSKVKACGKLGILTLIHIAKLKGWWSKLIDYKNSGDISGDKEEVVGYGAYVFYR